MFIVIFILMWEVLIFSKKKSIEFFHKKKSIVLSINECLSDLFSHVNVYKH